MFSGYQNPITFFTIGIDSLNYYYDLHYNDFLFNGKTMQIIMSAPGILNLLITLIDIPYRIIKLKNLSLKNNSVQ